MAGLCQLTTAVPAQAADDSGSVSVAVDTLSPSAPTDGDTLTVSGTVTNNGKQAVTAAHVGLQVGPELNTRSSIDTLTENKDSLQGATGSRSAASMWRSSRS